MKARCLACGEMHRVRVKIIWSDATLLTFCSDYCAGLYLHGSRKNGVEGSLPLMPRATSPTATLQL